MAKVLVTHPGRQHSHQAALGLARAGLLAGYWSGVPATEAELARIPGWLRRRFVRYSPAALPHELARAVSWVPAMRRLGDALLPAPAAARSDLFACRLFDRWVAGRLPAVRPAVVVACELSALETFKAARQHGVTTVLDAPSIHHHAQDASHGFNEPAAVHRRKAAIKNAEVALADHIVVVSELARQTYLDAGVPAERVHVVPLGVDLEVFAAGVHTDEPAVRPFTFVFAGATIHRKGIDLLVDALVSDGELLSGARLIVVGPSGDAEARLRHLPPQNLERLQAVTQQQLAAVFSRADCLVLPSRNDSFGMVVAEALATGCPVIVSEMVGARDLVTTDINGWVVPTEDSVALGERLQWCVTHAAEVRTMRPACRESANRATWSAYHERLANLFALILSGKAA